MQDLISQFAGWSSLVIWCKVSTLPQKVEVHSSNHDITTSEGSLSSKQILISILVKNKKTASK